MSSFYKGEGKFLKAAYFESGFYYTISVVSILVVYYLRGSVTISDIVIIQLIVISLVFIIIFYLIGKEIGFNNISLNKRLNYSNASFGKISVISNLNKFIPIFILSMYVDLDAVTIYKVSEQVAFSSGFVLLVVGGYYSSQFALANKVGNNKELFTLLASSMKLSLLAGVFSVIGLLIIEPIIFSITNISERGYKSTFLILLIASFINVAAGPVITFLTMCGKERVVEKLMSISFFMLAIFIPFLLYFQSIELVAITVLFVTTFQNFGATYIIYREKYAKKNIL